MFTSAGRLASHLDTTQEPSAAPSPTTTFGSHPAASSSQRAAQQRAAARVAELGFESMRAYLVDRLVTRAWTLAQVRGELGAAPSSFAIPRDSGRVAIETTAVSSATPLRRARLESRPCAPSKAGPAVRITGLLGYDPAA